MPQLLVFPHDKYCISFFKNVDNHTSISNEMEMKVLTEEGEERKRI
jgi:hypothetical protein